MAAVESCVVKRADDVPRDVENATATATVTATATAEAEAEVEADRASAPRRQAELYQFRATDLLYYASSVSFFFADVATDSIVCVEYLLQGHSAWGCFAMGVTVLPACVTQLFSLRWHRSDGSLRTVHWLLHFLLLGFLHRYLTLLYTAMHSLRNKSSFSKDKNWVYRQESDICMLQLFESFMGAAPQLILQLYIIAILNHAPLWTMSGCDLFVSIVSHTRATHRLLLSNSRLTSSIWSRDSGTRGIIPDVTARATDAYFGDAYFSDAAGSMFVSVCEVCSKFASINNVTMQIVANAAIDSITVTCLYKLIK